MKESQRALFAAYRRTLFRAKTPLGTICLQIGKPNRRLDTLLKKMDLKSASFITAWNPRSKPLPYRKNQARNARLRRKLDRLGYPNYPGAGSSPDGRYSEASFLALGVDRQTSEDLGFEFGQNAVVYASKGRAAQLLLLADLT